ncbi:DUF393 domain-containing protein [Vibrio tritonius]|uniref:DUF393 domain-containing protein n=1 Tax=Vibrio tritonius TaxID=1435069 RepID=A0ABS7YQU9_9VIBR|nr:DUF393 domain-containing protein [Vibrio tritonius]
MSQIKIFFDGQCPLCVYEMNKLKQYDIHNIITTIDINQLEDTIYNQINIVEARKIIHVVNENGVMLYGLDGLHCAWKSVGKVHWYGITRWRMWSKGFDVLYLYFARNRYRFSKLLTGKAKCNSSTCYKD